MQDRAFDAQCYTFRQLVSLAFDEHEQDNQQVLAGIFGVVCNVFAFPGAWYKAPENVELAADSRVLCNGRLLVV